MISFNNMEKPEELGSVNRGVAIIAMYKGKLLLLREFRMPVNDYVYNLVAGTIEPGETVRTASAGKSLRKRVWTCATSSRCCPRPLPQPP